jgi:nucleotide-binding universal stress UspA family protein
MLEGGHEITARDLQAHIVQQSQQELDEALHPELDGIQVTRMLIRGDAVEEIVKTARDRNAGLIVMSTRGHGAFYRFLVGSVTGKILHESPCPVWTGAHLEEDAPAREFSIRNVLCAVNLTEHSRHTASLAAEMAAAVDAKLTLVHITGGVEVLGPGGDHIDPAWQETIIGFAASEIAKLQQDVGTKAEVIIDSGNVLELLDRAAEQSTADVLVIGHTLVYGHLGQNGNGYGIIRASRIPVLSV